MDLSSNNHLTSIQFGHFLNLVERANNRAELLAVFNELPKYQSISETDQLYTLTQTFLRKLTPPIFGYLTESDFNIFFRDTLFVRSPNPTTSLWALICSLSQGDDGGFFQFNKCIALLAMVQRGLLQKALTGGQNSEDSYPFAFVLSSFASRVYNLFGAEKCFHQRHFTHLYDNSPSLSSDAFDRAAAIVANFEDNLLDVLLEVAAVSPTLLNIPLFTHILMGYGAVNGDKEFIRRFFSSALCNPETHAVLQQIFAHNGVAFQRAETRRNWEAMVLIVVTLAPDGQTLQRIFGDSVHSEYLRHLLVERAAVVPACTIDRSLRNSEKVADYLALSAPNLLATAFQILVQLFVDRCQVVEWASLHSHYAQALAIVDFARRIKPEQRCAICDELMHLLVPIVPQMIEITDCSRRQIGMLMSETLFRLFDFPSPPQFDYVEADPMLREFRKALEQQDDTKESQKEQSKNEASHKIERRARRCSVDVRVAVLVDSDDDEAIVREDGDDGPKWNEHNANDAYDNEDDAPSFSSSDQPAYLRDCLEILSSVNGGDQTVKMCHWVAAFRAIPKMLRQRSLGWNTLGEDLLTAIVQLDNRYNVPEFAELRAEILKLLLAQSPELVSNAFRQITSRCCPLPRRFLLISAVVNAAKLLANGGENEHVNANIRRSGHTFEKATSDDKDHGSDQREPKVIRRSSILRKQHSNFHQNEFLRVAPQFVFPLLRFNQFDHFYDVAQSSVFLGQLALALGELIACAAHSPSILCILSDSFDWLSILRRVGASHRPFVCQCCVCAYLAICDSLWPSDILRDNFTDELSDCHEWLTEMMMHFAFDEVDETARQSIGILSLKIEKILKS